MTEMPDKPSRVEESRKTTAATETPGSPDYVFDALTSERRRYLLSYLRGVDDGVATLDDLVDYVMVREADSIADLADSEDVTLSLSHHHLPKLANDGLIEYDARSQTARYRGDELVEMCLDMVTSVGME